jgi:two-component system cell cycle sensor histidine kinase/response regulator CckA
MIGAKADITERRQAETMHAVQLAVGLALEESASLGEAIPKILRTMCELQSWTLGALWLVHSQDKTLHCNALWHQPGLPAENFARIYRGLTLRQGAGLAGQVWKTGDATLCPDVLNEADGPILQAAQNADLHGGIAFPIHTEKRSWGSWSFSPANGCGPAHLDWNGLPSWGP